MDRPNNPYVAGNPLRGERGFFGRKDTLVRVERELRNRSINALVLFGQPRIGKTSLLFQLERTLPADAFLPLYFDLHPWTTRPLSQVLADLARMISEQTGLEHPGLDAFGDEGYFFYRTFMPQVYAALEENRRPVFLLDEFDALDPAAETELAGTTAARALRPFLYHMMRDDPRSAFVFVVGRRAEDLSLDFAATFKTSLALEIWVLDRESSRALVRQAEGNDTLRFSNQAVERVLSLTNCHPYLTQLLCQRIWERAYTESSVTPPQIDVPQVEAAVPDALEYGITALNWLWRGLSPPEKIYTTAMAEIANEGEIISEDQVIQVLSSHGARVRTREVELAPKDLVKRRVLEMAGGRQYRFTVELLRRWVGQNKRLWDVKEELDRMDPLAEKLFMEGHKLFRQSRWEDAIRQFRDALERNPRHFRAQLHLGEALLELGQFDEAVAELERAYELDRMEARLPLTRALVAQEETAETPFMEGHKLFRQSRWEDAIRQFRDALERNPRHFRAQLHLGEALLELGQLGEAVAELERAYELNQTEAHSSLTRALVAQAKEREESGDEIRALDACERVLRISPNEQVAHEVKAAIWIRRGDAALDQDNLRSALEAYQKAGDPDRIARVKAAWIRWGDTALERHDLEAALMAYRQVGDVERIAQVEAKQQELAESAAEGVRLPLLGKYQIEHELGAGGGGRVYLAQDELGRKVALKHRKALTPDDQKQVEILLEEARAVASLRHPNVAMVYTTESDPDSGDYSVVMEYADGGALADLLETEGRLSFERALDIGIEVCSALEYVHNQGRIHGDIKPSNILFFHTYGRIDTKIADFGLSRSVQVGEYQPDVQEGLYSGTLEYAAPEMFGGEKVDGRTDLYSLGVVLYEMLVGEPPFPLPPSGDLATVIAGHLHGELRPPKERRPAIFDELDALICRALAKSPSERFQDAQEMLAALQEVRKLCTQYHKQAEELYNQGIRLEGQDRWSEAVSSFEKASALNPELRDVEQRLENARLRLELERTWREMERLLAGEDWAEALEQLGRIGTLDPAYRAEEVEEKTRYVRLQLELASLYGDARAAEGARERQKAIRLYVRIISQDYSYRDATQRLDRLQTEEELEYLWAQGERLTRQESWEEAAEVYEQILEKRPSYPGAAKQLDHAKRKIDLTRLYTQAQTELEEKNWDKAVEILTEIITIEPDYRDAATSFADTLRQQRLGQLYRDVKRTIEQHRWTDAEALLEELLRLQRGGRDARQKVEQQLEYVRQWKNVDELYQQALKKHKACRWDEAIEILENALRVANAAKLDLYDDHKIGLLLTDARLSRQLDTLREKSRAYETDGDLDSLVQVLDQMLELGPTNQEVQEWKHSAERRIHLGDLYNEALSRLDARDWAGARSRLDEIFDIDPEYREVRDKRGQAVINQCVDSARRWGFPLVIVLGGGLLLLLVPGLVAEARKQLGVGSLAATLELAGAVLGVFVLLASLIGLIIPIEILYRLLGRSNRWRAVLALGVLLVTACLSPLLLESVGPRLDPNNLCNGSFEDGLNCWEKGGDLRQTVECEAGQCYAILGSPDYPCWGGVPVGEAWIKQKAKVPQVISPTLSLRYRVFSYDLDLPGFDYFQVTVDGELLHQYGNHVWTEASCDPAEPWDSGWQTQAFDLSPYRGKEVEISFHNVNGTQPYYNTWTYIDDVKMND